MDNLQSEFGPIRKPAPAHLWAVGVISLLWNSFGCVDYTMTKLDPVGYLASMNMGPTEVAYMQAMPVWFNAFWALGVWGSLAGSVLLLLRSRHAVTVFALALLGLLVTQLYQFFGPPMPPAMATPAMYGMTAVIWASMAFFLWYARKMAVQGVLR
ncbi:hypothetical protein OVA07_14500 [Novosphingobium sp. SL115]|uniref:hypothetical protein n=1 Tax=Novosphingobium sp. SL115 TaxID=2995150 RepID=UPI002274D701|nr:hypothetical protein [Novosphingobium sp. SL115]MCY1672214.1 hypothetical protein [Novosphingobium sp. SL115]